MHGTHTMRNLIVLMMSWFLVAFTATPAPAQTQVPYSVSYTSPLGATETLPSFLRATRGPNPPKIGLVLTGGGARGIAQIGVLKTLDRAHIKLHLIVGTSIGALIGGLYAAGYTPDELDSIARTTDWDDLLVVGDERYRRELTHDQKLEHDRSILALQIDGLTPIVPDAISLGERFTRFVNRLVWNAPFHTSGNFDDMRIPFRAIATDIVAGRRVVFDRGNLSEVLRASATAPLRFTPIEHDSMLLVDGGLLSNIPTDVAKAAGCDIIIVVNTTSLLHAAHSFIQPWDVADQVVTVMMRPQYAAALRDADIVITPDIGSHPSSDFSNIDSLIFAGERASSAQLATLLDTIAIRRGEVNTPSHSEVHFRADAFNVLDAAILAQGAAHTMSMPAVFDSLVATGRYARLTLNLRPNAAAELEATPNPTIHHVHVLPPEHPAGLDSIAATLEGSLYGAGTCTAVLEQMLRWYRRSGYAFGTVTGTKFDAASGTLDINVADGLIKSIQIDGNLNTDRSVIARELPFTAGLPFNTDDGIRALSNLGATNIFKQATLEVVPGQTTVDVRVHVAEQHSQVLRISGRLDNERNTQLGVEVGEDNLFGEGMHIGALIFGGVRNTTAELTFSSNRILTTYLSYNATVYSNRRDVYFYRDSTASRTRVELVNLGEYAQTQTGLRFSVGENVPQLGLLGVTARYEYQTLSGISGTRPNEKNTVFSLHGQLVFDTQNDFPFPTSGTLVNLSYESGFKLLGADVAFTKFSATYDTYLTLEKRSTFHPQFTFGYADATTPTADQFRIGGQFTFYGLREDQYLGKQMLTGGLEYRYKLPIRIFFDAYATARYDIGTVWGQVQEIHFGDLRHGLGVGLSFETPIGPAEFAAGRSFTLANPIGGKSFAVFAPVVFYFSVGSRL